MSQRMALLASVLLLPLAARAQPVSGLYINAGAGIDIAGAITSANDTTKAKTDPGLVALLGLGWGFGQGLRAEIEGSYRSNAISGFDTERANGASAALDNTHGTRSTHAIMANLAYDIPLGSFPIQPYIGAGVGYGWLDFGGAGGDGFGTLRLSGNNSYTGPTAVSFGSAGALAYQAMIGAAMPLRFVPGLSATIEYRLFGMTRADVPVTRTAANPTNLVNGAVPSSSTHDGFVTLDHAILVGLRYDFGGPS